MTSRHISPAGTRQPLQPSGIRARGEEASRSRSPRSSAWSRVVQDLVIGFVTCGAMAGLFLLVGDMVVEDHRDRLDRRIDQRIHAHATHAGTTASRFLTNFGSTPITVTLILLAVGWLMLRRRVRAATVIALAWPAGEIATQVFKSTYHRTRPDLFAPLAPAHGFSFPSGHVFTSVVTYGLLATLIAATVRGWWKAVPWAVASAIVVVVAYSRIELGVHYPSDVLGSLLIGGTWLMAVRTALRIVEPADGSRLTRNAGRPWRRPAARSDASTFLGRGDIGPLTIGLLVVAYAALWLIARPSGEPLARHVGQTFGAMSVLLMSISLVLISTLPWIEEWFHGIDRAAIWHRRVAISGLVLLVPHIILSSNPDGSAYGGPLAVIGTTGLAVLATWSVLPRWRDIVPARIQRPVLVLRETALMRGLRWLLGGYERWRTLHRTTGIFLAAGFVHGLMDATAFGAAPILRWSYVAIGGIGLTFYAYRELVARFFLPMHDYQVAAVKEIDKGLVEITLAPIGRPLSFMPGQFAMVYLEAKDGWHRHPFTVTSAPHEGLIRVTVKSLGDYTSRIGTILKPGMPAIIGGPHGRFTWRTGTKRQVWIGAGVGVAPFLSWLRSLDADFNLDVDFFYTTDGKAPFADEVLAIGQRHPSLRVHLIDTRTEGRLSPARVLATTGVPPRELSVYMCGPHAMLQHFGSALRRAGVPRAQIHREYFNWR